MKPNKIFIRFLLAPIAAALLSSCGGSDDESGGPVEFNVVPAEFGYTSPGPGCAAGAFGDTFLINGGTAPYTVESTAPNVVVPSTSRVESRGGGFTVSFTGSCTTEEGVTILVKDALNRQFTVTVSNIIEEDS